MSKPPKSDPAADSLIPLFKTIGLTQAKAVEAAKSPKSAAVLQDIIEKHSLTARSPDEKQAGLLAALAVLVAKSDNTADTERAYVVDKILEGKLKSPDQVNGKVILVTDKFLPS